MEYWIIGLFIVMMTVIAIMIIDNSVKSETQKNMKQEIFFLKHELNQVSHERDWLRAEYNTRTKVDRHE